MPDNTTTRRRCDPPVLVAWTFGHPWPVCAECHRHVYMIETTGQWKHFT